MMEDGRGGAAPGSLFGGYQSPYGQGGSGGLSGLSPYLNVDPSYLASQQPEFIRNDVSITNNQSFTINQILLYDINTKLNHNVTLIFLSLGYQARQFRKFIHSHRLIDISWRCNWWSLWIVRWCQTYSTFTNEGKIAQNANIEPYIKVR